jgi:hypothetical protein
LIAPSVALKYLATSGSAAGVVLDELLADPKLLGFQLEIEHALAKNVYRNSGLFLF